MEGELNRLEKHWVYFEASKLLFILMNVARPPFVEVYSYAGDVDPFIVKEEAQEDEDVVEGVERLEIAETA